MVKNIGLRLVSDNPVENYILQPTYKFFRKKCKLNKYQSKMGTGFVSGVLHAVPFFAIGYGLPKIFGFDGHEGYDKMCYLAGAVAFVGFPVVEAYESIKHYYKGKKKKHSLEEKLDE